MPKRKLKKKNGSAVGGDPILKAFDEWCKNHPPKQTNLKNLRKALKRYKKNEQV